MAFTAFWQPPAVTPVPSCESCDSDQNSTTGLGRSILSNDMHCFELAGSVSKALAIPGAKTPLDLSKLLVIVGECGHKSVAP